MSRARGVLTKICLDTKKATVNGSTYGFTTASKKLQAAEGKVISFELNKKGKIAKLAIEDSSDPAGEPVAKPSRAAAVIEELQKQEPETVSRVQKMRLHRLKIAETLLRHPDMENVDVDSLGELLETVLEGAKEMSIAKACDVAIADWCKANGI
eukprot:TRINITY_DN1516_c0_g1_i16.p1 TRINITY_DN1516_c0_g1~~TRINITY_DN1516_c0_g1_i16.p1  ORF type:complete len:166 (+),score=40.61 TRINITY_DN1516_c0_g1_i16:37-498(+)